MSSDNDRDFTNEEREAVRLAAPEFATMHRREVRAICARYGASMPEVRAILNGKPTAASLRAAREEQAHREAARRYGNTWKADGTELSAAERDRNGKPLGRR